MKILALIALVALILALSHWLESLAEEKPRLRLTYPLSFGKLRVSCLPRESQGQRFTQVAVRLPEPLITPMSLSSEHHAALAEMGWTRLTLIQVSARMARLEYEGSNRWQLVDRVDHEELAHAGSPEPLEGGRERVVVGLRKHQLLLLSREPDRSHREGFTQAVAELAAALLDERHRPWRELAAAQDWVYEAGLIRSRVGQQPFRLDLTGPRAQLHVALTRPLPAGFRAMHKEHLDSSERFDHPVLDLLLSVVHPPAEERFRDERVAELMLAVLHGLPGSVLNEDHIHFSTDRDSHDLLRDLQLCLQLAEALA